MSLSIYVHIPYCIQRCRYCDFTTFEQSQIMPPSDYLELIKKEIRYRHTNIQPRRLRSIYFGGGTPSLVPSQHIVSILEELASFGFEYDQSTEVTIEINPATVSEESLKIYMDSGINRFSVGAQTFKDSLLKVCGREHDANQTRQTLELLKSHNCSYTFDLLFALPGQSTEDLQADLDEISRFCPPHLSAYCLTVPSGHPMATGRPTEDSQVSMFKMIEEHLDRIGLEKYEISNFAQPGRESRHNLSYWQNKAYWGLGLSSHSYFPDHGSHGIRFWNPTSFSSYISQVNSRPSAAPYDALPDHQVEKLATHESLTDICHMHLRTRQGLALQTLSDLFGTTLTQMAKSRLEALEKDLQLEQPSRGQWRLTAQGELLSNQVFSQLTFSPQDVENTAFSLG